MCIGTWQDIIQQGVIVTGCTACSRGGYQSAVAWIGGVLDIPVFGVTGLTVTAGEGLAVGAGSQAAVGCAVAVRAVFQVRGDSGSGQGIFVTGRTVVRASCRHQVAVIRRRRMGRAPDCAVTGGAITTGGEVLTDRQAS